MKIFACPHCGAQQKESLVNGVAFCENCRSMFDSSLKNRLLSASWLIRKHNYHDIDQLISHTRINEIEGILVNSFVNDNAFSTEEFKRALDHLGI